MWTAWRRPPPAMLATLLGLDSSAKQVPAYQVLSEPPADRKGCRPGVKTQRTCMCLQQGGGALEHSPGNDLQLRPALLPAGCLAPVDVLRDLGLVCPDDHCKHVGQVVERAPANSHPLGRQAVSLGVAQAYLPATAFVAKMFSECPVFLFQVRRRRPGLLVEQRGEGRHHANPCFLDHDRRIGDLVRSSQTCRRGGSCWLRSQLCHDCPRCMGGACRGPRVADCMLARA